MVKAIISGGIVSVPNKAGIPITPKALKMFEPVTFPIARSTFPFFTATIETTSSGKDVPIAITEIAMISVPISKIVESSITDWISQSAEK